MKKSLLINTNFGFLEYIQPDPAGNRNGPYDSFNWIAIEAEHIYPISPSGAAERCRSALENAIICICIRKNLDYKGDSLGYLIGERSPLKEYMYDRGEGELFESLKKIQTVGNAATHYPIPVNSDDALECLAILFEFIQWIDKCLNIEHEDRKFNVKNIPAYTSAPSRDNNTNFGYLLQINRYNRFNRICNEAEKIYYISPSSCGERCRSALENLVRFICDENNINQDGINLNNLIAENSPFDRCIHNQMIHERIDRIRRLGNIGAHDALPLNDAYDILESLFIIIQWVDKEMNINHKERNFNTEIIPAYPYDYFIPSCNNTIMPDTQQVKHNHSKIIYACALFAIFSGVVGYVVWGTKSDEKNISVPNDNTVPVQSTAARAETTPAPEIEIHKEQAVEEDISDNAVSITTVNTIYDTNSCIDPQLLATLFQVCSENDGALLSFENNGEFYEINLSIPINNGSEGYNEYIDVDTRPSDSETITSGTEKNVYHGISENMESLADSEITSFAELERLLSEIGVENLDSVKVTPYKEEEGNKIYGKSVSVSLTTDNTE